MQATTEASSRHTKAMRAVRITVGSTRCRVSICTAPLADSRNDTKRCTAPPATRQTQASTPIIMKETPGNTEPATTPSASTATVTAAESSAVTNPASDTTHIMRETRRAKGRNNETTASNTSMASNTSINAPQMPFGIVEMPNARESTSDRLSIAGEPSCAESGSMMLPKICRHDPTVAKRTAFTNVGAHTKAAGNGISNNAGLWLRTSIRNSRNDAISGKSSCGSAATTGMKHSAAIAAACTEAWGCVGSSVRYIPTARNEKANAAGRNTITVIMATSASR